MTLLDITFVDDEGNDVRFEILDVVTLDEKEYLVVLPIDEVDSGVLILEIKQEDGEEVYDTVTDDEEAEKVLSFMGYELVRQKGSHRHYLNKKTGELTTIKQENPLKKVYVIDILNRLALQGGTEK